MWLVIVGVLLILLKFADVSPVAGWSWLWVLSPLVGAQLEVEGEVTVPL